MDKNTFIERIQEIGICEDTIKIRELLTKLNDEVSPLFDSLTESASKIDELTKTIDANNTDMEDLRKANMELFKRVGSNSKEDAKADLGIEPEKEKLKFEDLFKQD